LCLAACAFRVKFSPIPELFPRLRSAQKNFKKPKIPSLQTGRLLL